MNISSSAAHAAPSGHVAAATGTTNEYLTFRLGSEEYGIDILRVQEIRSYEEPTRIANSPEHLKGVINLRGIIVPIVDLRLKLAYQTVEYNTFTVVVVLNVRDRVIGTVVDSVSDVIALNSASIKPPPEMHGTMNTEYITGLATVGERMLILMDIEALLSSSDMGLITASSSLQ